MQNRIESYYICSIKMKQKLKQYNMKAIGQLKTKATAHCTICCSSLSRNLVVNVYENTPEAIGLAKLQLTEKANKPYTCRICKSIEKSI